MFAKLNDEKEAKAATQKEKEDKAARIKEKAREQVHKIAVVHANQPSLREQQDSRNEKRDKSPKKPKPQKEMLLIDNGAIDSFIERNHQAK